jgi:hypothetical protein
LVTSAVLLDELEEVLERFFPRMAAVEARVAYEEQAEMVTSKSVPEVALDPDDDHVIAPAVAGLADWSLRCSGSEGRWALPVELTGGASSIPFVRREPPTLVSSGKEFV